MLYLQELNFTTKVNTVLHSLAGRLNRFALLRCSNWRNLRA